MLSQYFASASAIVTSGPQRLELKVPAKFSDFVLLELSSLPILEWVVGENAGNGVSSLLRTQPFLQQTLLSDDRQQMKTDAMVRTFGQGVRLYTIPGKSNTVAIAELRQGITLYLQTTDNICFSLETEAFQLISLEADQRLFKQPQPIQQARAVLAVAPDFNAGAVELAVQLAELLQASYRLKSYQRRFALELLPDDVETLLQLQDQLEQKRQWLVHCYNQALSRHSYRYSANQIGDDQLQRILECYELLAPPELTAMVKALAGDDSEH
ncbi:hypothetical protein KDN34_09965 [Shewanella yunxiaonensis]|uniref:Uncharacterized protein n=1 Tax=Shewanella yunxiaonensis TaxID=2829809 RepID=A0ABX7YQC8_9GAMM|nr:hypothetical protein [Shewanella yunxiaonensis]QUN04595.1 hypothetical protein KDN34_09965 [Shewanella yunxiaonensis]